MNIPVELYPLVDRYLAEKVMAWHLCKASFEYSWDSGEHIDGLIILNTKKEETWRPCTDLNDVKLCVDKVGFSRKLLDNLCVMVTGFEKFKRESDLMKFIKREKLDFKIAEEKRGRVGIFSYKK